MSKLKPDWFCNCGAVESAFSRSDWSWLAGWIAGRFAVEVSAEWVQSHLFGYQLEKMERPGWSDGSWAMYWKSQLIKAGLFGTPGCVVSNTGDAITALMHFFFLSIDETPEQLERLRSKDTSEKGRGGPSTPGIARTNNKPEPIDRVASRVVHGG